jgi:hypothetical protein
LGKTRLPLLFAILLLWSSPTLQAQDKRPLVCLTDLEGGIPYIFGEKGDPESYIGFEVDLMNALEKELGRPIKRAHAQSSSSPRCDATRTNSTSP